MRLPQTLFFCLAGVFLMPFHQAHAAPYGAEGMPIEFTQPDGAKINLRVLGDEFYGHTVTEDGYTVVFDPQTQSYQYAALSPDGNEFALTGMRVGKANPKALGLAKGLDINPAAKAAKARKNAAAHEAVVKQGESWEAVKQANRNYRAFKNEVKKQEKAGKKGFVIPLGTVFPDSVIPPAAQMEAPAEGDGTTTEDPPIAPAPPTFTLNGNVVGLTILVDFSDDPGTVVTQAQVDDYFNKPGYTEFTQAGSVYDYFFIQSGGKLRYNNNVTYYVRVPQPKTYYNNTLASSGTCGRLLLNDALDVLIANGYDFSKCSTKPISGKNYIRACNVLFAGANSGVWAKGLWPHRSSITAKLVGTNTYAYDYQITEIGTTANLRIGTVCHENGHMLLGYPDLYSYDGNAADMGNYSLMAGGNYGGGGKHPTNIDPYLKEASGWMDLVDLNSASQQRCTVQVDGNQLYRYLNPAKATEYFLFEVRDNTGWEGPYGAQTTSVNPGTGLVAYHAYETGTSTYSTIFTASNPNCDYTKPYELLLVEANPATAKTPWYDDPAPDISDAFRLSGKSFLTETTTPDLKFWVAATTAKGGGRLTNSGANINNISADSNVMTFVAGSGSLSSIPGVMLSRTTINSYTNFGTNAAAQTFTICNSQGGTLNYSITNNQTWLSCTPASGSVTTGSSAITVNYSTSGLAAGTHTATITVTDPAASPSIKTITVTLIVTAQPVMTLSTTAVSLTEISGSSGAQTSFALRNTGGGSMNYTVSGTQPWLSMSPASGTVVAETDTIYVIGDASSLAQGTYTDTLTVTSAQASNSPLTLTVNFTVKGVEMVVLSPNGGEQWGKGQTKNITWSSNLGGNVKIELLKGGVPNSTLAASIANTGSFSWAIPGAHASGTDYSVKVTSIEDSTKTDTSNATFSIMPNLADAVDATELTWSTTGSPAWFPQTATTQDGVDAAQSGAIGDSQSTSIQTTVTGPGTLTYWWKVSSESGYDLLSFYLNDVLQSGRISGNVDWVQKTVSIPAGSQTIKWTYSKDASVSSNSDTAWVDQVIWTPSAASEIAVEQPVGTNLVDGSATVNCGTSMVNTSATAVTFTIKNTGISNLTGLTLAKTGTHASDFTLGSLGSTTVAPNASTTFTVTFKPSAAGARTASLQIGSNDLDENPFDISLTGTGITVGTLAVSPVGGLTSSGTYGGPFSPGSQQFTLSNPGNTTINWTAANSAAWVTLSATSGTLTAGGSTTVTVTINSTANSLNVGNYSDTVSFTNTTNSEGNTTRSVNLTIDTIEAAITLGNLLQTYDGSSKPVTVTTKPAGLAYSITYNGSSTVPTNVGTYAVVATVTQANYVGSASDDLVIAHKVTYLGNGHTGGSVPADQYKYQNVDLALATNSGNLSKTDYTFIGWNTAADGSGTDYPSGGMYTDNESLTLYAQWSPGVNGTWLPTLAGPFDWGGSANWSGGNVAAGLDRTASFTANITADQTVNLEAPRTIGNITFNDTSNNLTISGTNTLTLARTGETPSLHVPSKTLTISSNIEGTNGLNKTGAGILTLSGPVTLSGGLVVTSGSLRLSNTGNSITGGFTLNGGTLGNGDVSTTTLNNNNITVNASSFLGMTSGTTTDGTITLNADTILTLGTFGGSATINGAVTGSGSIILDRVGLGSAAINLNSTGNTFTGNISFTSANTRTLNINSLTDTTTLGAGNIRFSGPTAIFTLGSGAVAPLTLNNRQFEFLAGAFTIGNNSSQTFTINTDLLIGISGGSHTLGLAGTGPGLSYFNSKIENGTLTSLGLTKSGGGTWVLGNNANTYTGVTTISAGTLQVSKLADGDAEAGSSIGKSSNAASNLVFNNGGRLLYVGSGDSTDRLFTFSGTSNGGAWTIESSGTGALSFTSTGAITFAGTSDQSRFLNLNGSNTDDNTFAGQIVNNGTSATSVTKLGLGKWVLTGTSNTYTGAITVNGGTLELRQTGTNTITQSLTGALTNGLGEGTLISNRSGTSGSITTTFGSYSRPTTGATGNIVSTGGTNGTDNSVNITGGSQGFIDKGLFFGGSEYAARSATGGYVRALLYGTDASTATTATASKHVKLTSSYSGAGMALLSLNLQGSGVGWTNASSNLTTPGILKSGGGSQSTISGGNVTTTSNAELVIRTDTSSDSLLISSNLTQGSGALTKSGAGTLTLSGTNTYTGATMISAGKLLVNNTTGSGNVSVAANATLGGTGIIGGNTTIAAGGCLEFTLSTNATNHDKLEIASGKTLTFSGASTLTITSSGGAAVGAYTLLSAPGGITVNTLPTLILPNGWSGTVSKVGTDLVLNLTTILTPFQQWAVTNALTGGDAASTADPDGDGWINLHEFAFGTSPNAGLTGPLEFTLNGEVTKTGSPVLRGYTPPQGKPPFQAVFGRRKNHAAAGIFYTAEFSANLSYWTPSSTGLSILTSEGSHEIEVVAVPFPENVPLSLGGTEAPPKFFRIRVATTP